MLTYRMVGIGDRRLQRIPEDRLSFGELNAVVSGVRCGLARIPLELHRSSVGLFAAIRACWFVFGLTAGITSGALGSGAVWCMPS